MIQRFGLVWASWEVYIMYINFLYFFCGVLSIRVRRFFVQVGHETMNASIGNKQIFTKTCHGQNTAGKKLSTFLENKAF
jgi:hypothetical protein